MTDQRELDLELERYELFADPIYNFTFNRRQFLKVFTGGIALLVPTVNLLAQQDQGESGARGNQSVPNDIGAWIHIDEAGTFRCSPEKSSWARTFALRWRRRLRKSCAFRSRRYEW
ncbi:MAG TPA: hypothetical protein VFS76_02555 [Pyrinomonadaceae bacterium]|nr:hypothetical protein [Pyrinomonadaceae bacterium]